jgi:hypothetical protein
MTGNNLVEQGTPPSAGGVASRRSGSPWAMIAIGTVCLLIAATIGW